MADKNIQININAKDNASTNINSASSSLRGFYKNIVGVNTGISKFTDYLRSYNNSMSGLNRGFKTVFREAAEMVAGFTQDAISNYSALADQHAKTLGAMANDYGKTSIEQQRFIDNGEKLKQQAIELSKLGISGKGSLVSAVEISKAQEALIKSGKNSDQLLTNGRSNITPVENIVQFAVGNGLDMETAVDFAVTLGEQFNYSMDNWGEMLDKVSHAADTSIIEVEDIVNSMKYAGGIASGLNRPMEEVLTMLSVMGNAGLKGSISGTGVQAFFTRLLASGTTITDSALEKAPGEAAQTYLDFYSSVVDANGDLTGMDTVLGELDAAMQDLNDDEQTWFARKVFSLFQMKAAYALTSSGSGNFEDIMAEIRNNSLGTNENKYNLRLASQSGRIEALKQAWESTKTDIGDRMHTMVTAISDELLAYLQNNGKYDIDVDNIRNAIDQSRDDIASAYGTDVADFIANIADTVVDAGLIGEALLPQVGGIGSAFVKLLNGDVTGAFNELSTSLDKTNTNIEGLPDELQDMAEAVRNVIIALTALAAINTTANIIQSAGTIWGVTGGALIGLGGRAAAGVGGGLGSYATYSKLMKNQMPNMNSTFMSTGMGGFDSLFNGQANETIDNVLKALKLNDEWNEVYTDGQINYNEYKNNPKAAEAYNNRMQDITDRLNTAKNNLTKDELVLYRKGIDIKKVQRVKANEEAYAKLQAEKIAKIKADKAAKAEIDELKKASYEESKQIAKEARKSEVISDITDSNNYKENWSNRTKGSDSIVQSNVVDYISPEQKVDDIMNKMRFLTMNGKEGAAAEYFEETLKSLDQTTKDVLDRKIKEAEATAKVVAKQNEQIRVTEEAIKSQEAMVKSTKYTTTDLGDAIKDVAKNSADKADEIGNRMPFTGDPINKPVSLSTANKMADAVDTIKNSTTISDDLLNASTRISSDLRNISKMDGVSEDASKVVNETADSIDDIIKRLKDIAKDSGAKSGAKATQDSIDDIDSIIDVARKLSRTNLEKFISDFSNKYGISGRTMLDYFNDMKAQGLSGDDIMMRLKNSPDGMAKIIADTYGTTDELSSTIWATLSKKQKSWNMTKALFNSKGMYIFGDIATGYLQDRIIDEGAKTLYGQDYMSAVGTMLEEGSINSITDLVDTIIYGKIDSYRDFGNQGFNLGYDRFGADFEYANTNWKLSDAITKGLGTTSKRDRITGMESKYYISISDDAGNITPIQNNKVATYGYIDGLLKSLFNESLMRGKHIPYEQMTQYAIDMTARLEELMSRDGLTDSNMNKNTIYYQNELNAMVDRIMVRNTDGSNKANPNGLRSINGSDVISNFELLSKSNVLSQRPTISNFNPEINITVEMDNQGNVLGTTVNIPDYSGVVRWNTVQKSKVVQMNK